MTKVTKAGQIPALPFLRRMVRQAILLRMVGDSRRTLRRNRKALSTTTFADLFPTLGSWHRLRVRGRLIAVEKIEPRHRISPFQDVAEEFLPDQQVEIILLDAAGRPASARHPARTDRFGYFEALLTLHQPVSQRTIFTVRTLVGDRMLPGTAECFVLPAKDRGPVLVSDVDKTYLESTIRSPRDIVRMLARPGETRRPLPGMPALTAGLTRWPEGIPLVFLSGTPFFFKRSLEDRFCRDGLKLAGLFLRPPSPPIEERFSTAELARFLDSLHHQFGFKVLTILQLLADLPDNVELLLWGDNNQHDPHVYGTISGWLDGTLSAGQVLDLAQRYQILPAQFNSLNAMLATPQRGQSVRLMTIRDVTRQPAPYPEELANRATYYETVPELVAILAESGLRSP